MTAENTKQDLLSKRDELLARVDAIKNDYRSGLDADLSEQAVQLENAEVLTEILRTTTEELASVNEQLEKLG